MTRHGFMLYSLSFLFAGGGIFGSAFFTALNNGAVSALISFLRALVFQMAAVLLLPRLMGLDGVWLTAPAAGVLTAALAVWFLIAVLRQERAQDRQEGEGTPQA